MVDERYWRDTPEDLDRQRRKQAEFLVHQECRLNWIHEIGVLNEKVEGQVIRILKNVCATKLPVVGIHADWYY